MLCPNDGSQLQMTDRQGIEIDYCPKCRGVWLDRGELDKIIDRSSALMGQPVPRQREGEPLTGEELYRRYDHDDDDYHAGRGRKRRGFFGDLFDFD